MIRISAVAFAAIALLACSRRSNPVESREDSFSGGNATARPMSMQAAAGAAGVSELRSENGATDAVSQSAVATPPDAKAVIAGTSPEVSPSMVIRTGQVSIEVDGLDPAVAKLRRLSSQLGGYVANSSFAGGRDQVKTATLEIKIPAAQYDQAVGGLSGIGKLESINTTAEDVGEEYVDIGARVANSRRLEDRLVTLLATRTGKLEDVLAVERELARVREEIERYDGRMRFLRTRAAVSTLTVTLHEPVPILGRTPGENPIATAFRQAWRNFIAFIAAFIASLGILIPLGAIAAVAWFVYRRRRKIV